MKIRTLKANEIECRVQQVTEKGYILLLYKDARVDQRILDEIFGVFGWEREHSIIDGQLFCTVRIWDEANKRWVSKQDVGTESMTEKEKGRASDSFKRACFNIGIGRELYSSPFIWVNAETGETYKNNSGKFALNSRIKFEVKEIGYDENREINALAITDQNGKVRYKLGKVIQATEMPKNFNFVEQPIQEGKQNLTTKQVQRLYAIANGKGYNSDKVKALVLKKYNCEVSEMTKAQYDEVVAGYEGL
ncbi:MAG: hypothetical protein ACRCX8_01490 [Sarcina sp.]